MHGLTELDGFPIIQSSESEGFVGRDQAGSLSVFLVACCCPPRCQRKYRAAEGASIKMQTFNEYEERWLGSKLVRAFHWILLGGGILLCISKTTRTVGFVMLGIFFGEVMAWAVVDLTIGGSGKGGKN
jgi:hypothetical protein